MTNPSDPWSRRPEPEPGDGPTEKVGPGDQAAGYGGDFGQAFGAGAGNASDPTEYFGQPVGPDATRVMPPHDAGWGAYEAGGEYAPTAAYEVGQTPTAAYPGGAGYAPTSSYEAGYASGGGHGGPGYPGAPGGGGPGGPGGYQPAGFPQQPQPPKPPRRTGVWVGLGIAAVILVALVGVIAGTLLANKDSSNTAASAKTTAPAFPTMPKNSSSQPLPSGIPTIPGLGDIDSLGANMGTIASNDGTTLTLTSLSGTTVTVHTDAKTQVISLGNMTVKDLAVGEMVMVQGDKNSDGSIQAKVIISTSLPGGTR
ncbi:DUF5666 domain-containing protein [Nocardia sp. NPDC051030]|uniref:DUF5666 domain-containing protein n=1 Tax=Nocardia sp. NPDC051030 TaxID=3155162 RepID=UPI003428F673